MTDDPKISNCTKRFHVDSSQTSSNGPIFQPWQWVRHRDTGLLKPAQNKRLTETLYKSLRPVCEWNPHAAPDGNKHGAIFNFDYSTDGSILVAACQHKSFLMFDPICGKVVGEKTQAHTDSVNCVRFLDGRLFATCSDDQTVALWDCRYLKSKIRSFEGHTHWVKNIEYDSTHGLLVTSGFDGNICTWNINNYSSQNKVFHQVYSLKGLMRSKLTPDNSKLIMSTCRGYMVIIHNLDLETVASDIENLGPNNIQRLKQPNQEIINEMDKHESIVYRKRNRVEYISDFQNGSDAEVVSSIQWTCVHDIQSLEPDRCNEELESSGASSLSRVNMKDIMKPQVSAPTTSIFNPLGGFLPPIPSALASAIVDTTDSDDASSDEDESDSNQSNDVVDFNEIDTSDSDSSVTADDSPPYTHISIAKDLTNNHLNLLGKRLMFLKQEPNVGEGFIKELCFSHDGRIICSPYKDGVRLLAFNEQCDEICDCVPSEPKTLHVINTSQCHNSYVLATKFSPTNYTYVSGCLSGKVFFHQPLL